MSKIERYRDPTGRRKAKWDLTLNPFVTMLILSICIGVLLVWIGLFEKLASPNDGVVSPMMSNVIGGIKEWLASLR